MKDKDDDFELGWIRVDGSDDNVVCTPLDGVVDINIKPRHVLPGPRMPWADTVTLVCPICKTKWEKQMPKSGVLAVGPDDMICKECK